MCILCKITSTKDAEKMDWIKRANFWGTSGFTKAVNRSPDLVSFIIFIEIWIILVSVIPALKNHQTFGNADLLNASWLVFFEITLETHVNELCKKKCNLCICRYPPWFFHFSLLPLTLQLKEVEFHALNEVELHSKSESHSYKICGKCNEQKFTQRDDFDFFECHFSFST